MRLGCGPRMSGPRPDFDRAPFRDFLFVQSTTEVGGAESALLNMFAASAELRRRSAIAILGFGEGNLPDRLRDSGAEVIELPRARLREPVRLARTLMALRALVRERGIRVIVGNGAHPQILAGAAARLSGAKTVFLVNMIHPVPLWANDPRDALAILGPCDLMLAISKSSQATLERLRPNVEKRLLYWGTPLREVSEADAQAARATLGARAGELLVGVFGRLQRWKGQDVFIEAAAQVLRQCPDSRFAVVGGSVFGLEPEFADALRARAQILGIADRIVFTGFRTDVAPLMAACDIVCHTTRVAEPFGLVLIEAMGLGRAVIATRGGGPSEIIESDEMGALVPAGDATALASAIADLARDPDRRRTMGARALSRVREAFTIESMADNLIRHLDGAAAAHRSSD
jgi:glycosyltransferase involved in cell wall biosynthesis